MKLPFSVKSRTPIVTGDYKHRNKEILPTGLLGSLRYQYWLLKAMEEWQTSRDEDKSPAYPPYSIELAPDERIKDKTKRLCEALKTAGPVVALFGATGWKRMFKLEITRVEKQGGQQPSSARANTKKNPEQAPYNWNFHLIFHLDRESEIFKNLGLNFEKEITKLMSFVHYYGWLGSAPQNGFGWVQVKAMSHAGTGQENLTKIKLRPDNPVFFSREVRLLSLTDLVEALTSYYSSKKYIAEKKLKSINVEYRTANSQKDKDKLKRKRKSEEIKILRYESSLTYLGKKGPPIGYEIRRWLKDQRMSTYFNNDPITVNMSRGIKNPNEKKVNDANYVHISHPIVSEDNGYCLRIRCCTRPQNSKIINPLNSKVVPGKFISQLIESLTTVTDTQCCFENTIAKEAK